MFIWLQRWIQGIPGGSVHLYDRLATRYLKPPYEHVVEELGDKTSCGGLIAGGLWNREAPSEGRRDPETHEHHGDRYIAYDDRDI